MEATSNFNRSLVARAIEIARENGFSLEKRTPQDLDLLKMGIKAARLEQKCGATRASKEFAESLHFLKIARMEPPTLLARKLAEPVLAPTLAGKGKDSRHIQPPLSLTFNHGT
jgi:hypothetical protein